MTLQIITGDLSVNKKKVIIEKLLTIKEENPKAKIFYIVPDHLKFDMETFVLETIEDTMQQSEAAMIDLQVVSFTRLAWFIIRPQNPNKQVISDVGLTMIIRQLLIELKDDLIVLRGQINHQGFIEKLLALFNELIQGNITPDDLSLVTTKDELVELVGNDVMIPNLEKQKLNELHLIYSKFIDMIESYDLSQYNTLKVLEEYILNKNAFEDYYVVIDHYYYFNAQQMSLLMQLAASFNKVWLTLPITHSMANNQSYQPIFESVRHTYHQVKRIAQYNQIKVMPDWDLTQPNFTFNEDLLITAKLFKDIQEIGTSINKEQVETINPPIEVWESDTIQTELRHVSNQIHYLISQEGYRYQDIVVMTRNFDRYQAILKPYFDANNIPIFIDNVFKMDQHPFVILLESLLNLKLYRWKYDDIMGVIKSGLMMPRFLKEEPDQYRQSIKDHQVNYFENILLANGYFGYRLTQEGFEWHFEDEDKLYPSHHEELNPADTLKELANTWRTWLINELDQSLNKWNKTMTGQQASTWMYQLINDLGIREQFIWQRDEAIAQGDIEASRRDEQVWQVFVDLLDEFNVLYQDEPMTFDLFAELLLVGLGESSYHIIPATLDQVTITSVESPQVQPFKVAFLIGMDAQTLPLNRQTGSLLDEQSRSLLQENLLPHQYLMNTSEQQYSQELLLAYQLLLHASERLYISYASSVNNQSVQLSPYFTQVAKLLALPVYKFTHNLVDELKYLHTSTFGSYSLEQNLALQIFHYIHEEQGLLDNNHKQVLLSMRQYNGLEKEERQSLEALIEAVEEFNNLPKNIPSELAIELFGRDINASVSKIEQYYQDPYSHFLIHGLKIKERKLFELDYARSGDYFHEFLDTFTRQLIDQQINLKTLKNEQLLALFKQVQNNLTEDERFNIMSSHAKFNAIKEQMDQQLLRFIEFTQAQHKYTKMQAIQSEAVFGLSMSPDKLKGFTYPLKSGGKLSISGKIDRVDIAKSNDQRYLQIVDYKSGNKYFNIVDTYYGLDLQVLTYLSVALNNFRDTKPFGAFYQPVIHSYLTYKDQKMFETKEEFEALQLAENTFNGFISVDEEQLSLIDSSIELTNSSLIYPVKFKKDGLYNAYSRVFTEEDLNIILNYVHHKFKEAANQIQDGIIELRPFKDNQFTTSLQPNFRVITGFDSTENYQVYREKTINSKQVIEQMQLELDESSEDENV